MSTIYYCMYMYPIRMIVVCSVLRSLSKLPELMESFNQWTSFVRFMDMTRRQGSRPEIFCWHKCHKSALQQLHPPLPFLQQRYNITLGIAVVNHIIYINSLVNTGNPFPVDSKPLTDRLEYCVRFTFSLLCTVYYFPHLRIYLCLKHQTNIFVLMFARL